MPKHSTTVPELKNLGRYLLRVRMRQGLTQKELAGRSRVSQSRISGIEKGGNAADAAAGDFVLLAL